MRTFSRRKYAPRRHGPPKICTERNVTGPENLFCPESVCNAKKIDGSNSSITEASREGRTQRHQLTSRTCLRISPSARSTARPTRTPSTRAAPKATRCKRSIPSLALLPADYLPTIAVRRRRPGCIPRSYGMLNSEIQSLGANIPTAGSPGRKQLHGWESPSKETALAVAPSMEMYHLQSAPYQR